MAHYDETTVKCHGYDEVTMTFTSTVMSALPRQVHRLLLSNLDLLLPPIDVSVFFCYAGDDDAACSRRAAAATTLKAAPAKVLGAYFPLAGEVVANAAGEPELLCSGRGVDFTEATTDGVKLRELRIGLPDESVQKLVPKKKSGVMSMQVTKFKCGGAVVGCTFDHRVCDAYSYNMFLVAWAAEARGTSIPLAPSFNRCFLVPCSPPTPCTAGTLADRLFVPVSRVPPPPATAPPPTAFNRIYHVAAADVAALQASTRPGRTKLEAFTAHLWQLYSRARQHLCCMGVVVGGRARMCPDGAMRPYFGNVLTIPYGVISASDLRDMALEDVAEDVHRWVAEAATGEHFRELVDWVEVLRPEPTVARAYIGGGGGEGVASCVVSSGLRLPFGEVDFGWGRPAFASYHFPWPSGTGYVMPMPSARGGGDWVVYVHAAPEVVKVMEEEPTVFRAPDSSDIFG